MTEKLKGRKQKLLRRLEQDTNYDRQRVKTQTTSEEHKMTTIVQKS